VSDLGNKEIFSYNIQYYMLINNKDRNDICKDLDVKYSTFNDWHNGNVYPRIDKIEMLANYFKIQKSDLIEQRKTKNGVRIPILGRVVAGIAIEAVEEIIGEEVIPESLAKTGSFFGLQVKGNSMEPRFTEGDFVIVKQQPDIESGDIAVVLVNGSEATIKRILKDSNGITLVAFNNSYLPKFYSNEDIEKLPITIIGKVIKLIGNY